MTNTSTAYNSPSLLTESQELRDITALIEKTMTAFCTPNSGIAELFSHPDMVIAGSGVDEYFVGPEEAGAGATMVSDWGLEWKTQEVHVWRRGDVAWAQIPVLVRKDEELNPYRVTAIFGYEEGKWVWLYWGGCEPQVDTKV